MPSKNLGSVFIKCSSPTKIDVATKYLTEETGKHLVVNPRSGRVNLTTKLFFCLSNGSKDIYNTQTK
jgi:hypothetical protein